MISQAIKCPVCRRVFLPKNGRKYCKDACTRIATDKAAKAKRRAARKRVVKPRADKMDRIREQMDRIRGEVGA